MSGYHVVIVALEAHRNPEFIKDTIFLRSKMTGPMNYIAATSMVKELRKQYKEAGTGEMVYCIEATMIVVGEDY